MNQIVMKIIIGIESTDVTHYLHFAVNDPIRRAGSM